MFTTIRITLYSYKSKILPIFFLETFQLFQINIRMGVLVYGGAIWTAVIVGKRLTLITFKRSTWSREKHIVRKKKNLILWFHSYVTVYT